ncbi:MAG: YlxR family protein [Lachnospiraceae bacterium]|nr:YlxR family protein [Lachnospiraceae bacterium]
MSKGKKTVTRKCAGCGEIYPKDELIRIVREPSGEISLDSTGKTAGRGAYLCSKQECLEKAVKRKGLERSLKAPIGQDIYERLREILGKYAE